ncbi:hypothetical protein [Butyrivibrio fibrisolvens]|jgi:hypothetical protein|uniref:Uncharacterized protein n=1 Tax=Butyrivibrio fibrisolvens TaxID=831 RepID=A0A1H9SP00_BUTFI|nr:hypothetical protein [Butyrivibrio fibrisolvens]SER86624.1 hypothetical protein SAMN04487884_112125 [Butyrivibrio fibrisolvens]
MGFENVCKSLKNYFSNNKILAPLQMYALPVTLVCGALMVLQLIIPGFSLGWFYTLVKVAFYLFFFMLLGTENFLMIAIALGLRAVYFLIDEIQALVGEYSYFSMASLIYVIVFGFLTYLAYMKSIKK